MQNTDATPLPDGIKPESIARAHQVVEAFVKHLNISGSVQKATEKATKETGARAEVKTNEPRSKDK